MKNILLALILFSSMAANVFAQFTVDGEYRIRTTLDHGFKVPVKSETSAIYSFDQRTRLLLNYTNKQYSTRITLQDARIWGADDLYNPTGVQGNSSSFGIYEAWVDLKIKGNSSIRIGRQEWNYDDMRILCWRNWWTSGLSYDALLYKMHSKETGLFIDLGFSYNNDGGRTGMVDNTTWTGEKIKTMNFLNIRKEINDKLSTTIMLTLSGKENIESKELLATGTHGLVLKYNKNTKDTDGLFALFSGYYQHGTDIKKGTDGNYKSISAYLISTELGYRTLESRLEVSAGMELISGRDYTNSDSDYNNIRHSFDLQYSARIPYYGGYINHFLIQDSYKIGTKGGGYFDPYLKLKYGISKKSIVTLGFFMPVLTTNVEAHTSVVDGTPTGTELDANGEVVYWKGNLGSYLDLGLTQKFSKEVVLKLGVSYAMVSDIKNQMVYGYKDVPAKQLYTMGQNYFGWAMLIVKPKFFNSESK